MENLIQIYAQHVLDGKRKLKSIPEKIRNEVASAVEKMRKEGEEE